MRIRDFLLTSDEPGKKRRLPNEIEARETLEALPLPVKLRDGSYVRDVLRVRTRLLLVSRQRRILGETMITRLVEAARSLKHRAHAEGLARRGEGGAALDAWRAVCADVVRGGPFAGMRYPRRWGDASAPAKWLGSYEAEVLPALSALVRRSPQQVVVVGSAEGYYSVGLARALPSARVDAFDSEFVARWNTRRLARLNRTTVRVHGTATPESLAEVLTPGHALVVCDCEGYEDELLDPTRVPALRCCDLLVELHEVGHPGMGERIAARFAGAHVEFIHTRDRDVNDYEALSAIDERHRPFVVREFRYAQRWMVVTAAAARTTS